MVVVVVVVVALRLTDFAACASLQDIHKRGTSPLVDIERVEALETRDIGKPHAFEVKLKTQTVYLAASDEATRRKWVAVLKACLYVNSHPSAGEVAAAVDSDEE